jgi:hypothetical protein
MFKQISLFFQFFKSGIKYNMLINFKYDVRMKIIHTHCVFGHVDYHHNDFFSRKYNDYIHKFSDVQVVNNNDIYVSSEGAIMFDEIVYPRNICGYLYISGKCSICTPHISLQNYDNSDNSDNSDNQNMKIIKEYKSVENFSFDNIKVYYTRNPIQIEQNIFYVQSNKHLLPAKKIEIISQTFPHHSYKFYDKKNKDYGKEIELNKIIEFRDYFPKKTKNYEELKIVLTSEIKLGIKGDFLLLIYY